MSTQCIKLCEYSVEFDPDEGRSEYQEEIYEYEIRLPFTRFRKYKLYWTDVVSYHSSDKQHVLVLPVQHGDKLTGQDDKPITRDEFACPEGWQWSTEWQKDINGAIDEDGAVGISEGVDENGTVL